MGFGQSVSTCFSKYLSFRGRAVRSEFWWWVVFVIIVSVIANFLDSLLGTYYYVADSTTVYTGGGWIATVVAVVLFLPSVSVAVRRLHDTGKSGWWWWLSFICFLGWLILFIFYVSNTSPYENKYGPSTRAKPTR